MGYSGKENVSCKVIRWNLMIQLDERILLVLNVIKILISKQEEGYTLGTSIQNNIIRLEAQLG